MNKKNQNIIKDAFIGLIGIILSLISFLAKVNLDLILYISILTILTIFYSRILKINKNKTYTQESSWGRIVFASIIDYIVSFLIFVLGLFFVEKSKYISVSLIYNSFLYFYIRNVLFQSIGYKILNIGIYRDNFLSLKKKIILLLENVFLISPITMFIISTNLKSNLFESIMELFGILWLIYIIHWIIKKKTIFQKVYSIEVYKLSVNDIGGEADE